MSWCVFWKMFGDVCLYFSVVSTLPSLFPHQISWLLPALLCGTGAAGAAALTGIGKNGLRYLGLVPAVLTLTLARCVMDVLLLIPVLVYCAAAIQRCAFALEYYDFQSTFLRTLKIWGCGFAMVALIHGLETQMTSGNYILESETPLSCGLMYIFSGVVLCRMLRMGPDEGHRVRSPVSMALTLGGAGLIAAAAVALERLLQNNASSLADLLTSLILLVIGLPGQLINRLMEFIMSIVEKGYVEFVVENAQKRTEEMDLQPLPSEEAVRHVTQQAEQTFPWWLALLVLTGLTLMLVFLLKRFRHGAPEPATGEIRDKVADTERKPKASRRTNRGKVRHYYRAFLKAAKRRGVILRPDQTSADIQGSLPGDTDLSASAKLREVYLAARYDETREVTRDQVEAARQALKSIQK